MIALVLCTALAQAPLAERRIMPLQTDLSFVAGLGQRNAAAFALYLGIAVGPLRPPWGTPFGGVGFEFAQQLGTVPYRASWGVQVRGGYAWSFAARDDDVLPDVLVFGRVTPFWGTDVGFGDVASPPSPNEPASRTSLFGVRVGAGVTVPWWTKKLLFLRPFDEQRGFSGDTLNVLATLLLAPLALLNHLELVAELFAEAGYSTLTFRFGTGF
ncbi:MAG: hypothetical protein IT380_05180 [Myxococcales bacterium]|nr:hypothetical protein [Myxococcales bacterium]